MDCRGLRPRNDGYLTRHCESGRHCEERQRRGNPCPLPRHCEERQRRGNP
jgi:hypothetical protein